MNALRAGQAAIARHEGKVWIVVCDERENLPLGGVAFEIRGGVHHIIIGDSTVGVASVMLRLTVGDSQRFYTCLFNELEEGVVESLATQPELRAVPSPTRAAHAANSGFHRRIRVRTHIRSKIVDMPSTASDNLTSNQPQTVPLIAERGLQFAQGDLD